MTLGATGPTPLVAFWRFGTTNSAEILPHEPLVHELTPVARELFGEGLVLDEHAGFDVAGLPTLGEVGGRDKRTLVIHDDTLGVKACPRFGFGRPRVVVDVRVSGARPPFFASA